MPDDLRTELQQARPFRSAQQEAQLNVIRTSAVLVDQMEKRFKTVGITSAQYNVLRILQGAEPDGLCRNEIRDRMLTRMPDMTRLLDRMEEAGFVVRTRERGDRRMVTTRLTPKARRVLAELDPVVSDEHARRFGHLSDLQLRTLIDLLTSVRRTI